MLSKRMEAVVNMVSPQSFTIADVGCDHAYVSIALIERKMAEKVIAMDIRKGPLGIAEKNVKEKNLRSVIDLRLSDGLEKLLPEEADTIIIAGMGGLLVRSILEKGKDVLDSSIKRPELILQPQSDLHEVRIFLQQNAYYIEQEKMLTEEGKYYTVIKAVPKQDDNVYSEAELLYGSYSLNHQDVILYEYLEKEKGVLEEIHLKLLEHVKQAEVKGTAISDKTMERITSVKKEIEINQEALRYYTV